MKKRWADNVWLASWTYVCCSLVGCQPATFTPVEQSDKGGVPVKTVVVQEQELARTTTQPATIHPYHRAEILARTSGYVTQVLVDIGDYVKQGQELAIIDLPELKDRERMMQSTVIRHETVEKRSEAEFQLAIANVASARAKRDQAASELSRVDASLTAMQAEFERTEDLVNRQSLERRILDEVRKKRDSEIAMKLSVESAVVSAEAEVNVSQAKLSAAEAEWQVAKVETEIARNKLAELITMMDYATLKAPFDGIVTLRAIDPGDLIQEATSAHNGQPLFVISHVDKVRIQTAVPEADAALVNRGDAVLLKFPNFPAEQPLAGQVTRINSDLDPSTRTMLIEVELPNPEHKLIPGMFGEATITLGSKLVAQVLPARAIRFTEKGAAYVYVVNGGTVAVRSITTGVDTGDTIAIASGLTAGEEVIDAHLKRFSEGDLVTVLTP